MFVYEEVCLFFFFLWNIIQPITDIISLICFGFHPNTTWRASVSVYRQRYLAGFSFVHENLWYGFTVSSTTPLLRFFFFFLSVISSF